MIRQGLILTYQKGHEGPTLTSQMVREGYEDSTLTYQKEPITLTHYEAAPRRAQR